MVTMQLEQLKAGDHLQGLLPGQVVQVVQVTLLGGTAAQLVIRDAAGTLSDQLVYPELLADCQVVQPDTRLRFSGDARHLRLVSEALRIQLAHLFDPYLAVHSSQVMPLPHQITAVYSEMLGRQPLRFLLADDPGAGKTVMAGLFIRELMVRDELLRCLVVAPGGLVEQWQDELAVKFGLEFDLLTRDRVTASRTADPFGESPLWIARMDMLSRDTELQQKLAGHEWDLIVVDEAHRMSARMQGRELDPTKRFLLGRELSHLSRHFLLMTATPHNGKDDDFAAFMSLLDPDRFEGENQGQVNARDLMRRMVKEDLLRFDGRPLFPERRSNTVAYRLSLREQELYDAVTNYVREEMNRADRLDETRRVNVGFALQTLQRRLASSPEAIWQSLRRRRERLEQRLRENEQAVLRQVDWDDLDDLDAADAQELEDAVTDRATTAQNAQELAAEIATLQRLEAQALVLRSSREDAKWRQLAEVLQAPEMFRADGTRRKMLIFSEARDTLNYLVDRVRNLLGQPEAVEVIHGGVSREARRDIVERFNFGHDLKILIANDAAGEGLNLQTANLMVNYDLPWNPGRLEQRFGRIHRIGQEEVCHLWNLLAEGTREGDVYATLLRKLENQARSLGGQVYDILGQLFEGQPLRELLMEAVRYGDSPEAKERLSRAIEGAVDVGALRALLEQRALGHSTMDMSEVGRIREDMERAEARKLQPHFIEAFFLEAFRQLGGSVHSRSSESGRHELRRVPTRVRERALELNPGQPVGRGYTRVTFDRELVRKGHPEAAYLYPGHPLLAAVLSLTLEGGSEVMRQGSVLIDPANRTGAPRLLAYLEHEVRDGRPSQGQPLTPVSRRLQFVELSPGGEAQDAGFAPHLEYRVPTEAELERCAPHTRAAWLGADVEQSVMAHAVTRLAPEHLREVREQRLPAIARIEREVRARLTREINHWDARARALRLQERDGKTPRVNSQKASERADDLSRRLERRTAQLNLERNLTAAVPRILGLALVVPEALVWPAEAGHSPDSEARRRVELTAMSAAMAAERQLGREPRDVSAQRGLGYDIESKGPGGQLFFIEVKGRVQGADTVTLTRNEILASRNVPHAFRLALVEVGPGGAGEPRYLSDCNFREPDFAEVAVTFRLGELLARSRSPH